MARKREKQAESKLDPNGWMTTFSDLVTLLLTFFVLLLSMSTMDVLKLEKLFTNFTLGTGVLELTDLGKIPDSSQLKQLASLPMDKVPGEDMLKDIFFKNQENNTEAVFDNKNVTIKRTKKGFAFVFGTQMMFEPGKAILKKEAMVNMVRLANIIKKVDKPISIEGHTDDILPPLSSKYKSNWELSMARALSVYDILVEKFGVNPWKIRVAAFGDGQPVVDNYSAEARSQNRRIEVLFAWIN